MPGPPKPADGDLIPWTQAAGDGDDLFDARWYIPIVRAINRRLLAVNALPIAEDTLHYWFPSSDRAATAWGQQAISGAGAGSAAQYTNFDGLTSTFVLVCAPVFGNNFETPELDGWRGVQLYKVTSATATTVSFSPISGVNEDPSYYDQSAAISIETVPIPSFLQLGGWAPAPGDLLYRRVEGAFGFPVHVPYPVDFGQFFFGYANLIIQVLSLLAVYVDPAIDWSGKTKPDMQALCQHHQDWMDGGSSLGFLAASAPAGKYFQNFNIIRPLFQTAYPCWPPQTPPSGYPVGQPFGGFTRKREREITSINDPGTAGQIARFIFSFSGQYDDGQPNFSRDDPSQYHGPSWLVPPMPHPPTPADQLPYSRLVMLYHDGAWAVHPDQKTIPDIVTFYGSPKPGDIFGPHVVNELRAAISLLTDTITDLYLWRGWTINTSGVQSGEKTDATGADASSYGHLATTAGAEAAYNAAPNPSFGSTLIEPGITGLIESYTLTSNDVAGPDYLCHSSAGRLYAFSHAHGMTRDIKFWGFSTSAVDLTSVDHYTFDAAGVTGFSFPTYPSPDGTFTDFGALGLFGTVLGATADHVDLLTLIGTDPQWLPGWPGVPAIGDPSNVQGIFLRGLACTCHWTFND